MIYLSDRIEISVNITGDTRPVTGIYRYDLYSYDTVHFYDENLVFVGNFYYTGGGSQKFDVTDIVRSLKVAAYHPYFLPTTGATYDGTHDSAVHTRFKIKVYFDEQNPLDSEWQTVIMCYRYPNYTSISQGDNVFFNMYSSSTADKITTAIQGFNGSNYTLIPHYPLKETSQYKFAQTFVVNVLNQDINLRYLRGQYYDEVKSFYTAQASEGTLIIQTLSNMFPWGYEQDFDTSVGDVVVYEDEYNRKIAVFDECYKRYYLFWQDRFGGYQSQAFNDFTTYSETFDVTETQNYKNERSKATIQVQPKWKLSSGWIKEEVYPLYESIFVSPILLLYDSQEDRIHEVIVNGDYTEKTYKGEKKLLNMTLDLEATSKQSIIY